MNGSNFFDPTTGRYLRRKVLPGQPSPNRPTPLEFGLYICVPAIFTIVAIATFRSIHSFAGDFHKEFWPAGLHLLHGQSPYLLGRAQVANGLAFPYPALAALLFTPFALVSRGVSEVLFTAICFAALAATLRVLRVRDWRLYGLVLLWAPVVNAWQSANLTLLLALGVALMWRHRDRPGVAGACAALIVSLKPFVWPVCLWLIATRRYRAAACAVACGAIVNAIAWTVVGWGQLGRYLHDSSVVSGVFFRHAYTPVALALHLGAGVSLADGVGVVCGLLAAFACVWSGWRRRDDLSALTLAVTLMWLASPVLWMHYFAMALVPLAIARPRLGAVWAAPLVLIICGSRSTGAWQIVLTLAVIGLLVAASLRPLAGVTAGRSMARAGAGRPPSQPEAVPRTA